MIDSNDAAYCCFKSGDSECSEQLLTLTDLDEEESLQLRLIMIDAQYFCRQHLDAQIKLFMLHQNRCCDPVAKHKTFIKRGLTVVTMEHYNEFKSRILLVPGQKLCQNCLHKNVPQWYDDNPSPILTQITSSSSSEFYCSPGYINSQFESDKARAAIDDVLKSLELMPIDTNRRNDKVSLY